MSLRRLTAPMRRVCHLEKEQHRCTEQFYPIVLSAAAWFELSMSSGKDKPQENASSCDPDKGQTERQGNTLRKEAADSSPARLVKCYDWRPLVESGTICRWLACGFAWQDQAIAVPWLRCAT